MCECGIRACDGIETLGVDPYLMEINGDDTEYMMCQGARWISSQEI